MTKLTRVIRLDGRPLTRAEFTSEGYLDDRPILTSVGIFEYTEPDGSIRRELRLPEEVFEPESLASYKGKPIVITHDAGLIDKNNVAKEQIGTIITEGYRDGDNVRAEIFIHDTDEMKESGLKELSLGYNLDLDETPGEYNGQPYDAIQRNIRINHLALVEKARAGENARLNIDSRDNKSKNGGNPPMAKTKKTRRADGLLSPDELQKAIAEYKAKYGEKTDADEEKVENEVVESALPADPVAEKPEKEEDGADFAAVGGKEEEGDIEKQVNEISERREDDEDIKTLCDIIDTLLAQKAFDEADEEQKSAVEPTEENEDGDVDEVETLKGDGVEEEEEENMDGEEEEENMDCGDNCNKDSDDEDTQPGQNTDLKQLNTDSIDKIVRERVKVGIIGRKINMDGLEDMSLKAAKKAIIRAVRPAIRLDGKSDSFIDALYACCADDINARSTKDTQYQKRQMFNKDAAEAMKPAKLESTSARERMIASQRKINKED